MRSLVVSAVLLTLCCVVYGAEELRPSRSRDCVNFYWRSYGKIIPVDAVVGGHDENGGEIYVGRGAIRNAWRYEVSALSLNRTAKIQVGALVGPVPADNVEILCANPLTEVRWVKTNCRNVQSVLKNEHPIVAGVDHLRTKLYVGRIQYRGQLLVGKLAIVHHEKAALYFIYNNAYHYVLDKDIEILVANV